METPKRHCNRTSRQATEKGSREYPGVAVNQGDQNRNEPALVKERTRTLNNNPRNDR